MATSNDDEHNQPAHPNLPTLDESSPAYPESGVTPRRPSRGTTNSAQTPVLDNEGLTATPASSTGDLGTSAKASTQSNAPTAPSHDHQAVRPNVDVNAPLDVRPRVDRTSRDEVTSTASPAYPTYEASRGPVGPRSGRAEPSAVPTDGRLPRPPRDDQGGRLVGVAEPYQPFVNPTEQPSLISEPAPASPEQQQLWSKDVAKQKLEQLKATRQSVARPEQSPVAKTSLPSQRPQDQSSQAATAANRFNTPATRPARYGTSRAIRNAEDTTGAQVEQVAQAATRDFILAAQRRAWQATQEVAEDTALSFADFMLISGPIASSLYVSRWVLGNMFGELLTRDVGGISVPLVPGYALGDLVDYSHHIKSLLIGLITVALYGFIIMLLYYWTQGVGAIGTAVQGGWQAILDLLGKIQL